MTITYAVTFEFAERPPLTHRDQVEGWEASTCASRAMKRAQKALKPVGWTSAVIVFLDRVNTLAADEPGRDLSD